jgi:hypothetical protein
MDAQYSIFLGPGSGNATYTGNGNNIGIGYKSSTYLTTGQYNCACGGFSGSSLTTANNGAFYGYYAGANIINGMGNSGFGYEALNNVVSGVYNCGLGYAAGSNYTTSESNNIVIGNYGIGGDNNVIRIGNNGTGARQQNYCYIAGIYGQTIASPSLCTVNVNGQLGSGGMVINGNTGTATGYPITITSTTNGSTVNFTGSGSTLTLNITDNTLDNMLLGYGSGNPTLSGHDNTAYGIDTLQSITTGYANNAFGEGALASLTVGYANVAIGVNNLYNLVSGINNISIGNTSGTNYTSLESNNIIIGNAGAPSESHVIRLGQQGSGANEQNVCYIAGIYGNAVTGGAPVICNSLGLIGTVVSSERYKEHIRDINKGDSEAFYELHPVKFNYKQEQAGETHYGLIAEEVEKIMPELVIYDREGRPDAVKYQEMTALLINAIQSLKADIDSMKATIAKLWSE